MAMSESITRIRMRSKQLLDETVRLVDELTAGRADSPERQVVEQTRDHLEDPFLVVVAGEFNAGKSSLINAILGSTVMPEGATPTTDAVTVLRYAPEAMALLQRPGWVVRALPVPLLQRLSIVDTPGTNAVMRHHEALTRDIVPRADVVLFATSADRPFSETERAFLAMLHEWRRRVVMVINKIDLLGAAERIEVEAFVRTQATQLFGESPLILSVSARQAQNDDATVRAASGMPALQGYLHEQLDDRTRLEIRLASPLGVVAQTVAVMQRTLAAQRAIVDEDVHVVAHLERQREQFFVDMRRDIAGHRASLAAALSDAELRGMEFFDEHIRFLNLHRLLRGDVLQQAFERDVAADLATQIDTRAQALVDWMIERNVQLWQGVSDYIRRQSGPNSDAVGDGMTVFQYNRQALIRDMVDAAGTIVASYDRSAEAAKISADLKNAVTATALIQVGAIGLGALIATLLKGAVFDTTGVVAASVIALGGLYIIPARRRALKKDLHQRLADVRQQLMERIDGQFEQELQRMDTRVRDALGPYTRLVASEVTRLTTAGQALTNIDDELAQIRADIHNALAE
jgi:small GTP-binding protein